MDFKFDYGTWVKDIDTPDKGTIIRRIATPRGVIYAVAFPGGIRNINETRLEQTTKPGHSHERIKPTPSFLFMDITDITDSNAIDDLFIDQTGKKPEQNDTIVNQTTLHIWQRLDGVWVDGGKILFWAEYGGYIYPVSGEMVVATQAIFGDYSGGDYAHIETDGTLRFYGDATATIDLQFSTSTAKVPASHAPTFTTFVGSMDKPTFDVDDYLDLEGQELNHNYAAGTDMEWHCHIYTNGTDGTDRAVKVQVDFVMCPTGSTPTVQTLSAELVIPAGTPDRTHMYLSLGAVDGSSMAYGADISARVTRITATGTAPTADPFISMVGLHYQVHSLGSRNGRYDS